MPTWQRSLILSAIGAAGAAIQLATVALLAGRLGVPVAMATVVGIEAAVLHNFCWHQAWTWGDCGPSL